MLEVTQQKMRHVVFVGPQGAGKGTQAARVATRLGLIHLATGDLFRELMASESPLATEVRSYYDAGNLVPDELTARVLFDALDRLGWGPVAPVDGAFYLWAGISEQLGAHPDSVSWCRALLEDAGVALVPGTDMDPVSGGSFVRLSFATSPEVVRAAVERIVAFQGS